jgi:hypothetical protein
MVPKVISWYTDDFGTTNYSIMKTMEPYLSHSERKILESGEFVDFPISIKHLPFAFECRALRLKKEECSPKSKASDASVATESSTASTEASVASSVHSANVPRQVPNAPEDDMDSLLDFLMA